jgi:hypothetical protein
MRQPAARDVLARTVLARTVLARSVLARTVLARTVLARFLLAGALLAGAGGTAGCAARAQSSVRAGAEELVLSTDSGASNPDYKLLVYGVFRGTGTSVGIGNGQNQSLAMMPGGTFVVSHPVADLRVRHQSVNPRSCEIVVEQTGTFTVSRGTGAFRGITGYGTETVVYRARLRRGPGGKCKPSRSGAAVGGTASTEIRALGSVLLPP